MVDEIDRDEEGGEEGGEEEEVAPRRTSKSSKKPTTPSGVGGNAGNMIGRARTKEDGTPNSKWQSHEAELMWPEILERLTGQGKSAYDVEAQIVRVDPPGATGAVGMGAAIDGTALMGDTHVSPSERLMQIVTDTKHMPTARGPARYEVRFVWKLGAGRIGTGILNLPSPAEIMALRNAAMQQQYESAQQQPPQSMPHGAGATRQPLPQPSQQPPWPHPPAPWMAPYGYGQYGYGQPPPWMQPQQLPQGLSPEMSAMQAELAATRGALNEALAAAREGRQPRIEGVAAAPPPSEDAIAEKVTARVLLALQRAGALGGSGMSGAPAQAAPAAAAAAPGAGPRGMMDELFTDFSRIVLSGFKSGLEKSVKAAMGVGAPPVEEADAEIAEPAPAEEPFKPPFDVAPVADTRWPDGTPVQYAADRKTGDISPMGLAFGNPYMIDKGTKIVEGLTGALTDALKTLARPSAGAGKPSSAPQVAPPQVVREIPPNAVDASTSASEGDEKSSNGFPSI